MKDYIKVHFKDVDISQEEVLAYYLDKAGAESLQEVESDLIAYFEKSSWTSVSEQFQERKYEVYEVENKNWNAAWEASFQPVMIDDFCYVRAPFHEALADDSVIDVILEPRMAFGTAHHETTFMMMSEMEHINFLGQCVFDYGCGTAILSVLAEKQGAREIFSIDIEENAVENAIYNAEINGCSKIRCEVKTLPETRAKKYDTILANINRRVLLESAYDLKSYITNEGILLMSGILEADLGLILENYSEAGWVLEKKRQRGEWMCLKFSLATS